MCWGYPKWLMLKSLNKTKISKIAFQYLSRYNIFTKPVYEKR